MNHREIRHGYGHDPASRQRALIDDAFAYHLRRYRHVYGAHGISQRSLALIAHVSRTFIENLESGREMQVSVEALLRVAIALRHPIEDLVAPERIEALRDEIERRRSRLGGDAALPKPADATPAAYVLAVAYRSPHLIVALSDGKTVLEVRQYRAVRTFFQARELIRQELRSNGAKEVIVEEDTKTADYVRSLEVPYRTITFERAKRHVHGTREQDAAPTSKEFFHALVAKHPELARYVRVFPVTGKVALSERWRTARLTAATLALAAPAADPPKPPHYVVGDPSGSLVRRRTRRAPSSSTSSL